MADYTKAIDLLRKLSDQYPDRTVQWLDLRNHALAIIRNCNDDAITAQFEKLTTFNFDTYNVSRYDKTYKAIEVAITGLETKGITDVPVSFGFNVNPQPAAPGNEALPKVVTYGVIYLAFSMAFIWFNNWQVISQFQPSWKQIILLIALPILFPAGRLIPKIPERWFAIGLSILILLLDKLLPEFSIW
jgi:hypothetical protein